LKANDAILAQEKHMGLYEDLLNNYDAKLIAGGAAQNTARGAQVRICFYKEMLLIPIRT
jgi:adenosine kinase